MASGPHPRKTGGYEVRWREGKRNRSKTFRPVNGSKKADQEAYRRALEWKEHVEEAQEMHRPVLTRREMPTLQEWCLVQLAERNLEQTTLRHYLSWLKKHVFPQVGHLPLVDCTPMRMDEWRRDRLKAGAGRATIGKTMTLLGSILEPAVRLGYLPGNPIKGATKPEYERREHRWLTAEQVEQARSWYLERDDVGSATLISVLAYVGLRPQAALGLKVEDVGRKLTVVRRVVDGEILSGSKTSRDRRRAVYLPEPVRVDLDNWIVLRKLREGDLIFGRKDGKAWTRHDWANWRARSPKKGSTERPKCFAAAMEAIGLAGTPPYALRHTAASLYLAAGWTPVEVAHQLDHSLAVSMSTYQHLIEEYQGVERRSIDGWIMEARGLVPASVVRRVFAGNEVSA